MASRNASDEQPTDPKPIHFTRHMVLCVDDWPPQTTLTEEFLRYAHVYGAAVDGDEIRFAIGNGEARYAIDRSRKHGPGFVATLVEGNDKANLRSRRRKFERSPA